MASSDVNRVKAGDRRLIVSRDTFREKSVVVTGASSGIGRALALQLADEGALLALAARDARRLDSLAVECQRRGGKAVAIPTDVADESRCKALIQHTQETYGRIDMVVNNAGMDVVSKLEDLADLHLFRRVVEVNYPAASCGASRNRPIARVELHHLVDARGTQCSAG